jgi:hypothetical protein
MMRTGISFRVSNMYISMTKSWTYVLNGGKIKNMDIKKISSKVNDEESRLGIYVWQMPDGRWVGDDEGNFLSITSTKGNTSKITALAEVVRSYGIEDGQPMFLSGRRKIDDEEFEYQQARLKWGLVPDPLDIGNYKDGLKTAGQLRG